MKTSVKKFLGKWGEEYSWDGPKTRRYNMEAGPVDETWLIGKVDGARNFAIRYYHVVGNAVTKLEEHHHDHGIVILHGKGRVLIGDKEHPVEQGDVVYIPPDTLHQIKNGTGEPLGFLCVIPAKREKQGKIVWSEEGLFTEE
ncbi:MAG: cupin domain-containing protein [Anaerolineales bacterium]|nr:cupin domain-containing protein [Anaerolineales bacterium]